MSATDKEKEELLHECVEELRRVYDSIKQSLEHVRNKALAMLVGEVAIATFLFTANSEGSLIKGMAPAYGYIAFGLGVLLMFFAFFKFLAVISTIQWQYPTEEHDLREPHQRFNSSRLEFLEYLHAEYMAKMNIAITKVGQRSRWFMEGIYALSAGVFLVILVKYGGGA